MLHSQLEQNFWRICVATLQGIDISLLQLREQINSFNQLQSTIELAIGRQKLGFYKSF